MLKGRHVLVIGLGESGLSAAEYAAGEGAGSLVLSDSKAREKFSTKDQQRMAALESRGARVVFGTQTAELFVGINLVVLSPGVPSFEALRVAEQAGVEVLGELELAYRELRRLNPRARVFAVGGTNGKSTVTTLVAALLAASSPTAHVFAGGNLGTPLISCVKKPWTDVVLETSSFQLERAQTFRPEAGVLLNVTDDHLDRYPSFDAYAAAKGNGFANQLRSDLAVIPNADPVCLREVKRGQARIATFGYGDSADVSVDDRAIVDRNSNEAYLRDEISLQGGHNALNVAAAIAMVRDHIEPQVIREVLRTFAGLEHRMAYVETIDGVRYYDDSKGTNVGATVTALLGLSEPKAVLIAGGRDKGGSYDSLRDALVKKGRAAVLIGEATPLMEAAFADAVVCVRAASMAEAVKKARELAKGGDAVLLSPACSSFDMFRDYKHRGEEFVLSVREEAKKKTA